MHVLCVAEKPSISKAITQILSGGQFQTRDSAARFIKNYDFDYPQTNSTFTVTAVAGHLTSNDFFDTHRKWWSCEPYDLFDAPVETMVKDDQKPIEANIFHEARRAQKLMIWTDCDREGEHIGSEIAKVARRARGNIIVVRARFSAIIAQQIHNAAQHPVQLDQHQADAVEARIFLDLKIGSAFTRMQTMTLQNVMGKDAFDGVVSYGPCQFPTLGFVVARYKDVKSFRPEKFWFIHLSVSQPTPSQGTQRTEFTWKRGHMFNELEALVLFENVVEAGVAVVNSVNQKETKKWKPYPLTTVELQKAGSRILKLSPKVVLDIAEKLYQQGFLSYPRTETDQYDPQFDFETLIDKQTNSPEWGGYATGLRQGDNFNRPRQGKNNDKAHPPIHPTAFAGGLAGNEKRVYDYITRRFLACCSKDALGWSTTIEVDCGGEQFTANGLQIMEKNYLEVYPYDKWSDKTVGEFQDGEQFQPTLCELRDGTTTAPNLLTEADLVALMDKNGIGTDATIAQHIETVVTRGYVVEKMEGATKYLAPSTLGIGLIEGYDQVGLTKSFSKPLLRRETERRMVQVCEQTRTKQDMLDRSLEEYKAFFVIAKREFQKVVDTVRGYVEGGGPPNRNGNAGNAGGAGGGGGAGPGGGNGGGGPPAPRGGDAPPPARGRPPNSNNTNRGPPPAPQRPPPSAGPSRPPPSAETRRPPPSAGVSRQPPSAAPQRPPISSAGASSSGGQTDVSCQCGIPAAQKTVTKESVTKGKKFWTCSTGSCKFFQFVEDNPSTSGHDSDVKCSCGFPAGTRTVVKDGPNKGRKFYMCEMQGCKYFQFVDEPPPTGVPAKRTYSNGNVGEGGGGGSKTSDECYKCGKSGHWASNCTNPTLDSNKRRSFGSQPSRSGSTSNSTPCFKCNQSGHWANNCPNDGGGSGTRGRGSTRGGNRGGRSSTGRGGTSKRGATKKKGKFGMPS